MKCARGSPYTRAGWLLGSRGQHSDGILNASLSLAFSLSSSLHIRPLLSRRANFELRSTYLQHLRIEVGARGPRMVVASHAGQLVPTHVVTHSVRGAGRGRPTAGGESFSARINRESPYVRTLVRLRANCPSEHARRLARRRMILITARDRTARAFARWVHTDRRCWSARGLTD